MILNYETLIGTFSAWLIERGIQVEPRLLIRLAEDDLAGDPRLFNKKATSVDLTTNGVVALPDDLAEILAWTLGSPRSSRLRVAADIDSASLERPGTPRTYHIVGQNAYLRPVPHEDMSSDLTYRALFQHLGPDVATNDYIPQWPSLYWYACQEQAMDYIVETAPAMAYRAKKDKVLLRVKSWQERKVFGGLASRKVQLGGSSRGF